MADYRAAEPLLSADLLKKIDVHLEGLYESLETRKIGAQMAKENLLNNQVRGLENLVVSTRRFSEIVNYVKVQTGKDKKGQWKSVGPVLLGQLEKLEQDAKSMCSDDPEMLLEIKKRLARGWIKQIVAQYMYEKLE